MADDRRQQLADDVTRMLAADKHLSVHTDLDTWDQAYIAHLLLPLLDRVAADAAAEALSDAARWLATDAPDRTGDGLSWQSGVRNPEHAVDWCVESLRDRAAELRAPARTDEEN